MGDMEVSVATFSDPGTASWHRAPSSRLKDTDMLLRV